MTIKYAPCQNCGTWDITGYIACKDKQLCPACSAPILGVKTTEYMLRNYLWEELAKKVDSTIPEEFKHRR